MNKEHQVRLEHTNDGSDTFYSEHFNSAYHSYHGAFQESNHIFINEGLARIHQKLNKINLLEYGFGTGLNAILSFRYALKHNLHINYTGIEAYPLTLQQIKLLNYSSWFDHGVIEKFDLMHKAAWNQNIAISHVFTLRKMDIDFLVFNHQNQFDLIYLDAFSPSKHPEAWQAKNLTQAYDALRDEGLLITYCAQGQFKRNLKAAGFEVQARPGPPGKREITLAWKKK